MKAYAATEQAEQQDENTIVKTAAKLFALAASLILSITPAVAAAEKILTGDHSNASTAAKDPTKLTKQIDNHNIKWDLSNAELPVGGAMIDTRGKTTISEPELGIELLQVPKGCDPVQFLYAAVEASHTSEEGNGNIDLAIAQKYALSGLYFDGDIACVLQNKSVVKTYAVVENQAAQKMYFENGKLALTEYSSGPLPNPTKGVSPVTSAVSETMIVNGKNRDYLPGVTLVELPAIPQQGLYSISIVPQRSEDGSSITGALRGSLRKFTWEQVAQQNKANAAMSDVVAGTVVDTMSNTIVVRPNDGLTHVRVPKGCDPENYTKAVLASMTKYDDKVTAANVNAFLARQEKLSGFYSDNYFGYDLDNGSVVNTYVIIGSEGTGQFIEIENGNPMCKGCGYDPVEKPVSDITPAVRMRSENTVVNGRSVEDLNCTYALISPLPQNGAWQMNIIPVRDEKGNIIGAQIGNFTRLPEENTPKHSNGSSKAYSKSPSKAGPKWDGRSAPVAETHYSIDKGAMTVLATQNGEVTAKYAFAPHPDKLKHVAQIIWFDKDGRVEEKIPTTVRVNRAATRTPIENVTINGENRSVFKLPNVTGVGYVIANYDIVQQKGSEYPVVADVRLSPFRPANKPAEGKVIQLVK